VTGVKPSGQGNENSQVALEFDRAELKGGQTMAIRSNCSRCRLLEAKTHKTQPQMRRPALRTLVAERPLQTHRAAVRLVPRDQAQGRPSLRTALRLPQQVQPRAS
jgi:hypothetical protein